MANSTPLVNLAILQALKSPEYQDEIDLFVPYIAISIRKLKEVPFVGKDIKEQLAVDFGISAPSDVIDILLARARTRGLIKVENHMFLPIYEKVDKWIDQYDSKSLDIEESIYLVADNFLNYTKENFEKTITQDQAISLIYDFLKENIFEAVNIARHAKSEIENIKNKNHLTASFITHIHRNKRDLWPNFKMITQAVMLANFLTYADQISSKKSYKNITVYLDTPIVMGLLGHSGAAKQEALKEILELLNKFKLDVAIFHETQREVEGILRAWSNDLKARQYDRFNPKTLELLRHRKIDSVVIETKIALLDKEIERLGVRVQRGFKLKEQYNCDVAALEEVIKRKFRGKWVDPRHDADALNKMHNSRQGLEPRSLNEKVSIFITPNSALAEISKSFFELSDRTIPYVASEKWLATMFWFKHPGLFNDLPERMLLTTAYGTMYSDNGFWKKFSERLDALHVEGKISEDDFLLVRYDSDLLLKVHEISVDKGVSYSDEDIFDVVSSVREKLLSEKDNEINQINATSNHKIRELEERSRDKEQKINTIERNISRFSNFIGTVFSGLILLIIVAFIFWASYLNIPIESIKNDWVQSHSKSALAIFAFIVTGFVGILSVIFGCTLVTAYKKIKGKISGCIAEALTK